MYAREGIMGPAPNPWNYRGIRKVPSLQAVWLGVEVSGACLNPMNAREGVMGEQPRKLLHHHGIEVVGFSPERDSSVLRTMFPHSI